MNGINVMLFFGVLCLSLLLSNVFCGVCVMTRAGIVREGKGKSASIDVQEVMGFTES